MPTMIVLVCLVWRSGAGRKLRGLEVRREEMQAGFRCAGCGKCAKAPFLPASSCAVAANLQKWKAESSGNAPVTNPGNHK